MDSQCAKEVSDKSVNKLIPLYPTLPFTIQLKKVKWQYFLAKVQLTNLETQHTLYQLIPKLSKYIIQTYKFFLCNPKCIFKQWAEVRPTSFK